MKNVNKMFFVVASTGILSIMSFAAIADSSAHITLEKMIQINTEKQLAAEGNKYAQLVLLAGSRKDELVTKKNEAASAYKKWRDLKFAAVSHYPNYNDFTDVRAAAKTYSQANKAFVDLQKNILAQKAAPLDPVAINALIVTSPTAVGTK